MNEYFDEGGSPKTGNSACVQRALFLARRAALSFRPLLLGSRSPTLKCSRSVVVGVHLMLLAVVTIGLQGGRAQVRPRARGANSGVCVCVCTGGEVNPSASCTWRAAS